MVMPLANLKTALELGLATGHSVFSLVYFGFFWFFPADYFVHVLGPCLQDSSRIQSISFYQFAYLHIKQKGTSRCKLTMGPVPS